MLANATSVVAGAMGRAFEEESWMLPGYTVRQIMQDERSLALPKLKQHPLITAKSKFYVSMKSLDTLHEYMHPRPLDALAGYQLHFVNCFLFELIDFSLEGNVFPTLKVPGADGIGPVYVDEFHLRNGARYQVLAMLAPQEEVGNISVFLKSPDMPTSEVTFRSQHVTALQRKACMRSFAVLGLASGTNSAMTIVNTEGTDALADPKTAEAVLSMVMSHGFNVSNTMGSRVGLLSGALKMFEVERTAASVSLPLVLQHLHFLQFVLQDFDYVQYRIVAPNKFAYAVHIPYLGGWEIHYAVNMNASYNLLLNLFTDAKPLQVQPKMVNVDSTLAKLFQTMDLSQSAASGTKPQERFTEYFLTRVEEQKQRLKGELPAAGLSVLPSAWTPDQFFTKMQILGLENLSAELTRNSTTFVEYVAMQKAKPLLQYLIGFYEKFSSRAHMQEPAVSRFSVEDVMMFALDAFIGCANEVWNQVKVLEADQMTEQHAEAFLTLLKTEVNESYVTIDYDIVPLLLRCCISRPPAAWWEVFEQHVKVHNAPKDVSTAACICATFLFHSQQLKAYFPHSIFPLEAASKWENLVQEACDAKPNLQDARERYEALKRKDAGRFASDANKDRYYDYSVAVAYAMLLGLGPGKDLPLVAM